MSAALQSLNVLQRRREAPHGGLRRPWRGHHRDSDHVVTAVSKGDRMELGALLEDAGLEHSRTASTLGHLKFPSMDACVHTEIQATPLGGMDRRGDLPRHRP